MDKSSQHQMSTSRLLRSRLQPYLLLLIGSVLVAICGCSTLNQKQSLNFKFQIYREGPGTTSPDRSQTTLVHIYMTPVPGGIHGETVGKHLIDLKSYGAPFSVALSRIESGLAAAASPATVQGDLFTFDPPDTRVARLGTFAVDETRATVGSLTGLRDPLSGQSLILIYVDRACSIHGADFNLVLTRPGLQWLENLNPPRTSIPGRHEKLRVRERVLNVVYELVERIGD
jgi:hypothetical protein